MNTTNENKRDHGEVSSTAVVAANLFTEHHRANNTGQILRANIGGISDCFPQQVGVVLQPNDVPPNDVPPCSSNHTDNHEQLIVPKSHLTETGGYSDTPVGLGSNSMNSVMMGDSIKAAVPTSFIPDTWKKIDTAWARKMAGYASHFSKDLPKSGLDDKSINIYCDILRDLHAFTCTKLHDRLLEHLLMLSRKHDLRSCENTQRSKKIEAIHTAVLKSTNEYNQVYLARVLEFMKLPQKYERAWLDYAINDVTHQYDIVFVLDGKKNFVEQIAHKIFNDCHNQRLRRGMMRQVGRVWYDRIPKQKTLKTVFGDVSVDVSDKMEVWVAGDKVLHGHIVTRLGQKAPTATVLSVSQLEDVIEKSETEDALVDRVRSLWRDSQNGKVMLQKCSYIKHMLTLIIPLTSEISYLSQVASNVDKEMMTRECEGRKDQTGGRQSIGLGIYQPPHIPFITPTTIAMTSSSSVSSITTDNITYTLQQTRMNPTRTSSTADASSMDPTSSITTTAPTKIANQSFCKPNQEEEDNEGVNAPTASSYGVDDQEGDVWGGRDEGGSYHGDCLSLSVDSPDLELQGETSERVNVPKWGTYVGNLEGWRTFKFGTATPCGKYFIHNDGCLYESMEHMNMMKRVETERRLPFKSQEKEHGGDTSKFNSKSQQVGGIAASKVSPKTPGDAEKTKTTGVGGSLLETEFATSSASASATSSASVFNVPKWGTYVGNLEGWRTFKFGTATPCGKFFIHKDGCLYQSMEHMNMMKRVESEKRFSYKLQRKELGGDTSKMNLKSQQVGGIAASKVSHKTPGDAEKTKATGVDGSVSEMAFATSSTSESATSSASMSTTALASVPTAPFTVMQNVSAADRERFLARSQKRSTTDESSNSKKRSKSKPFEMVKEDEERWDVEKIDDIRFFKGRFEFSIKWRDWKGDNTWEPKTNLEGEACKYQKILHLHDIRHIKLLLNNFFLNKRGRG